MIRRRLHPRRWPLAALAALVVVGCGPSDAPPEQLPSPDYEQFSTSVQPLLIEGCANPSGCHGSPHRPFALYAPGAHRKDRADTYSTDGLTDEETRANYDRTRSFGVDDGSGPPLLTKPLAEDAGGVEHLDGGDVYSSTDNRHFQTLRDWLEDSGEPHR